MIGFSIFAGIVLVIMYKMGFFKKSDTCYECEKRIKGRYKREFEKGGFCLCEECASVIHPQILDYAKKNWDIDDLRDYKAWEEATKEERSLFNPDVTYGYKLSIDTKRRLFSLGEGKKAGMVLRFADLNGYELNFKPEEIKEGLLGDKVKGSEYVAVELVAPRVYLEDYVKFGVKVKAKVKSYIGREYEYDFTSEFKKIIRIFANCAQVEVKKRNAAYNREIAKQEEIKKALTLFMFDSIDDVTEESLKQQRNTLIKAFHPDNNNSNEVQSQKINAAYELLAEAIKR